MIIGGKYELGDKIAEGTYATVYAANDKEGNPFAVKVESSQIRKSILKHEVTIYRLIREYSQRHTQGTIPRGIPAPFHYAEPKERNVRCLVLERLGNSFSQIVSELNRPLNMPSVLMLGVQMLHQLESLHAMKIVHRDIKPENILTGYGDNKKTIYICDFGLSRVFMNQHGEHLPDIFGESFSGLHHFAPKGAHFGKPQSQRDDLESLGYVMVYLVRMELPWEPKADERRGKYGDRKMGEMKYGLRTEELCKDLSPAFAKYLDEVKKLDFMEVPNYSHLRKILQDDVCSMAGENPDLDWA